MYQCGKKDIRAILPFVAFIDRKLVSWNIVEPITLCPGILKSSVCNTAK